MVLGERTDGQESGLEGAVGRGAKTVGNPKVHAGRGCANEQPSPAAAAARQGQRHAHMPLYTKSISPLYTVAKASGGVSGGARPKGLLPLRRRVYSSLSFLFFLFSPAAPASLDVGGGQA